MMKQFLWLKGLVIGLLLEVGVGHKAFSEVTSNFRQVDDVKQEAVMRMYERDEIDINIDIHRYLKSLALPKGKQSTDFPVTFKNLLDHSSGLTAGGYMGYQKGDMLPSDVQTFLGQKPASNKPVSVEQIPGTEIRYSGAGYTLAEIALADIYETPFEKLIQKWALSPIAMNGSSFEMKYPQQTSVQTALGHDNHGKQVEGG